MIKKVQSSHSLRSGQAKCKVQRNGWLGGWVAGCLAVLLVSIPALAQEKKSIAVLDFESPVEKQYFDIGKSASDYLTAQLAEIGAYRVIERSRLEKILKEHELGMIGVVDPDKVKRLRVSLESFCSGEDAC